MALRRLSAFAHRRNRRLSAQFATNETNAATRPASGVRPTCQRTHNAFPEDGDSADPPIVLLHGCGSLPRKRWRLSGMRGCTSSPLTGPLAQSIWLQC
jgi:hypothetical protein